MKQIYLKRMMAGMAFLSFIGASPLCAEGVNALLVWTKDGKSVGYELQHAPRATFSENTIDLFADGVTVSYPLEDYLRFTFGDYDFTDVKALKQTKAFFRLDGNLLHVSHAEAGENIRVYSADGKLLGQARCDVSGQATLPLNGEGIFIIKSNKVNFKISKR